MGTRCAIVRIASHIFAAVVLVLFITYLIAAALCAILFLINFGDAGVDYAYLNHKMGRNAVD